MMNRKFAIMDHAAQDQRLSHLDVRLLWLMVSAADRQTGVVRRKQSELAAKLGVTARSVQYSRDRLVACGYLDPIRGKPRGHVSAYRILTPVMANQTSPSDTEEDEMVTPEKANRASPPKTDKDEHAKPVLPLENGKAKSETENTKFDDTKGENSFAHKEPGSFPVNVPVSVERERGPRSRDEDALGPLGAELRKRISPASYADWFERGKAGLIGQAGGVVLVAVKNRFFADQLRNRFEPLIAEISGARVAFLIRGEPLTSETVKAVHFLPYIEGTVLPNKWDILPDERQQLEGIAHDSSLPGDLNQRAEQLLAQIEAV